MSLPVANDFWERALDALRVAQMVLETSPDSSASRAYYAAFYAVSAYFTLENRSFRKHTAVEAAVHRELVRPGIWPKQLGADYSALHELRGLGDYGVMEHVTPDDAREAVRLAENLLQTVVKLHPNVFQQ